jgi:hypothetical protein
MRNTYTVWHTGSPPSEGWWPASSVENLCSFRWYENGVWSEVVSFTASAEEAAQLASYKDDNQKGIRWRHRPDDWPARSLT